MATITATAATSEARSGLGITSRTVKYSVTSVTAADVLQMIPVQTGTTVLDVKVSGTNDGGAIVCGLSVGDGNDPNRFITVSSASAAVPVIGINSAAGGLDYTYTADDTIDITFDSVSVGSGTATEILLSVIYTMDK